MSAKFDAITVKMEKDIPLTLDELKYLRRYYKMERTSLMKTLALLEESLTMADPSITALAAEVANRRERIELVLEQLQDLANRVTEQIELMGREA